MDIYFNHNYGKLYESIENGICEIFKFNNEFGSIENQFIKRKIPIKVDCNEYFDIVTPYGYGGPIILNCVKGKKRELLKAYKEEFEKYCKINNIVSEFIRFNPIIGNHEDFKDIYDVKNIRKTLATNLKDYKDPIKEEFSKSARKTIRQVLKKGVTYKVIQCPNELEEFKKIYYSTMDRKNAADYYYFDDEYFNKCLEFFKENIISIQVMFEEKIIAASLYFVYNNILEAHLSGTLSEYLYMSPAYIIKYATALWAKENNIDIIHYGGGTSNNIDDPLYTFKKKFSQNTELDFYIGKKIWNLDLYKEICDLKNVNYEDEYFPAYRK
ncbi:peptidoglycan bridge formation glycyltransferase FemA/FemB family protein [Clostridium perfringens]